MAVGNMSRDLKKKINIFWHKVNSLLEPINSKLSLLFLLFAFSVQYFINFYDSFSLFFLSIFYSYQLPLKYQKIPENTRK